MPFVMFLRVPVPYWYAFCEVFECGYAFCKFFEKQVIFSIQSKALIFGKKDKVAKFQKMVQQLYLKPRPCSNSVGLDDGAGYHLLRRLKTNKNHNIIKIKKNDNQNKKTIIYSPFLQKVAAFPHPQKNNGGRGGEV